MMESEVSELSELGKILHLVITVAHHPTQLEADDLAESLEVSRATVFRYIKSAQQLGVDLVHVNLRRGKGYQVQNWPQCRRRVEIWYDLECTRDVREAQMTLA